MSLGILFAMDYLWHKKKLGIFTYLSYPCSILDIVSELPLDIKKGQAKGNAKLITRYEVVRF